MVLNKALSPPHADSITQLAFCVDDTQLLSSSSDETIRNVPWDPRFSPDSTMLAAGHRSKIELFRVASGQLLHKIRGRYHYKR
ncbi:WD40 repeat domain-containing protein [Aspergillus fischeri NRRL 181]|uniref:Uncharacterized protein n=1 Tax=Neosartorya fischeri (strain ATCC 1020 / DSM 3700 / CBS 544.65 / FGSC A1164 / JCM 1740 / NRRL 181 / WB 181) TaxID=331117 RepID=A1DAV7_NEOFI|nr:uncharacterized protein NFIA_096180 [Aspergillus fischeri NRRL 181]EAW19997.1 hypothetical protein NFIA_096180 [Aspergillus fischeri NRRL 181]